jgi:hypothetical protein
MREYGYSQKALLDPSHPAGRSLFLRQLGPGRGRSQMSEWRRKGVRRNGLKVIASNPELATIAKDLEALNNA